MTGEPSTRPWHKNYCCIYDANGKIVASISSTTDDTDAAFIVDAVNERDHLRDLVKRMIPFVEKCHSDALDLSKTIKGICALKGVDTSEIDRISS